MTDSFVNEGRRAYVKQFKPSLKIASVRIEYGNRGAVTHWLLSFPLKRLSHSFSTRCPAHFSTRGNFILPSLYTEELFVIVSRRPKSPISDNSQPLSNSRRSMLNIFWRKFVFQARLSSIVSLVRLERWQLLSETLNVVSTLTVKQYPRESIYSRNSPATIPSPIIFTSNLHKHSYPSSTSHGPPESSNFHARLHLKPETQPSPTLARRTSSSCFLAERFISWPDVPFDDELAEAAIRPRARAREAR